MDDAYLNGQAKICGWQATLAYLSLCRHANISQESFPSIKLMAEENGVSRPTIIKGLESLVKFNVIKIKKTRNKKGQWLNNLYILIDKSVWKHQVNHIDTDDQVNHNTKPSKPQYKTKSMSLTLRKHIEGNTYKEYEEMLKAKERLLKYKTL